MARELTEAFIAENARAKVTAVGEQSKKAKVKS